MAFETKLIGKPWFQAKVRGYGSGWPMSWEGWVALVVFLALSMAAALRWGSTWQFGVVQAVLVAAFVVIAAVKTEDGWRWRS